jgi:triacylglycerol lipase
MGFTPTPAFPHSFPGIAEALQAKGATVLYPAVPAIASTREKAEAFKAAFLYIQQTTPAAKYNIIGHSHGGLYTRDAITNLSLYPYVASLTTVDSPHRGSYIDQIMLDVVELFPMFESLVSGALPFTGDPAKLKQNNLDLSVDYMTRVFNPNTPNKSGIYYQSFTCAYRYYDLLAALWDGIVMIVQALTGSGVSVNPNDPVAIAKALYDVLPDLSAEAYFLGGGLGDGLVQVSSSKWGTFLGTELGPWYSKGLNHLDAVNIQPYGQKWDAVSYWVRMVQNLKAKGY